MSRMQQTLRWCRVHTSGYEGVDVKNLSSSWKDGKALCALVHHFQPSLLDYNECLKLTDEERVELALKKMKEFGCPDLIDAEDFFPSGPDNKAFCTFLWSAQPILNPAGSAAAASALTQSSFTFSSFSPSVSSPKPAFSPLIQGYSSSASKPRPKTMATPGLRIRPKTKPAPTKLCMKCGKDIFSGEVNINGKTYHPNCFVCTACGDKIEPVANHVLLGDKFHCMMCAKRISMELKLKKQREIPPRVNMMEEPLRGLPPPDIEPSCELQTSDEQVAEPDVEEPKVEPVEPANVEEKEPVVEPVVEKPKVEEPKAEPVVKAPSPKVETVAKSPSPKPTSFARSPSPKVSATVPSSTSPKPTSSPGLSKSAVGTGSSENIPAWKLKALEEKRKREEREAEEKRKREEQIAKKKEEAEKKRKEEEERKQKEAEANKAKQEELKKKREEEMAKKKEEEEKKKAEEAKKKEEELKKKQEEEAKKKVEEPKKQEEPKKEEPKRTVLMQSAAPRLMTEKKEEKPVEKELTWREKQELAKKKQQEKEAEAQRQRMEKFNASKAKTLSQSASATSTPSIATPTSTSPRVASPSLSKSTASPSPAVTSTPKVSLAKSTVSPAVSSTLTKTEEPQIKRVSKPLAKSEMGPRMKTTANSQTTISGLSPGLSSVTHRTAESPGLGLAKSFKGVIAVREEEEEEEDDDEGIFVKGNVDLPKPVLGMWQFYVVMLGLIGAAALGIYFMLGK